MVFSVKEEIDFPISKKKDASKVLRCYQGFHDGIKVKHLNKNLNFNKLFLGTMFEQNIPIHG